MYFTFRVSSFPSFDLKMGPHTLKYFSKTVGLLLILNYIIFTAFWPTLPTYDFHNRGWLSYLTSLGTVSKITTLFAKFSGKKISCIFISKRRKNCFQLLLGKLKILLNHGFPPLNNIPRADVLLAKLVWRTLGKVKFP